MNDHDMRVPAILTTAIFAMMAACVGPNPAYRERSSATPRGPADAAVEIQPAADQGAADREAMEAGGRESAATEVTIDAASAEMPPTAPRFALLVVGDLDLEPIDVQSRERLTELGFTVVVKLDADATAADATGMDVVVISGSTFSSRVQDKFKSVPVPVVCHDSWDFPLMGLTGPSGGTDYGRDDTDASPDSRISILLAHPLAAQLAGVVTVSDRAIGLSWGKPLPNAAAVASLVGDASRITVFGYLAGAPLHDGTTAPARRVGNFVRNPSGARFAADGLRLFDAAVAWATAR